LNIAIVVAVKRLSLPRSKVLSIEKSNEKESQTLYVA